MHNSFTKEDTAVTVKGYFYYFFYFAQGCPSFVNSDR